MSASGLFLSQTASHNEQQTLFVIERTLGAALKPFATELRCIDAADYAAFIRMGQWANLRSIVLSSAELHFRPGTLELTEIGEVALEWSTPPLITLPMTFCHAGVRVNFRLRLAALWATLEVESIGVENAAAKGDLNRLLKDALQKASIAPATAPEGSSNTHA